VYNLGGEFNLSGGSIVSNNTASANGGGVYSSGSFSLFDGVISNNTANNGGGIFSNMFSMLGGMIANNTATSNGGGVYGTGDTTGGSFSLFDGMISNNTAPNGGGVLITTSAANLNNPYNFVMSGGSIYNNTATTSGGGVYNSRSIFSLVGGVIANNTANTNGGGVIVSGTGGDFVMSEGSISNNTAAYGGGVYNNDCTFSLSGSGMILSNIANNNGGGVYVTSAGLFVMSGGSISNNIIPYYIEASIGDGGGVYNVGTFLFDGGEISNNLCKWGGGVTSYGHFTMSDGSIFNNTAIISGGGVRNSAGIFTMSGGKISGNTATIGGGVLNADDFSLSGGVISNNAVYHHDGAASPRFDGGGVYNSGFFELTGSATISNNSAIHEGGGVYSTNGLGGRIDVTIISGGEILGNTAELGGGVYISGVLELSGSATISNNTATASGGGVYASSFGTFTMSGGMIFGNRASGTSIMYGGGGVYNNGIFSMTLGKIYNNTAPDGGGIYNSGRSKFEFIGGEIFGNTATRDGGGIYNLDFMGMYRGSVEMFGGVVSNNSAVSGGGVYNAGEFTMTGGLIGGSTLSVANTAEAGGGVFNTGSTASFSMSANAVISGNSVVGNGGGVNNGVGSTFEMLGGEISNNTARSGSAITFGGGVYNMGDFTLVGGKIFGNTVTGSGYNLYGGGVSNYGANAKFTMSGGAISNNSLTNNPSSLQHSGGGVHNSGNALFIMSGGAISNNTVPDSSGGGVYNQYGTFTMTDGAISGNTARYSGGILNDGTFALEGGKIFNNTAFSTGGGVGITSGNFFMSGGEIFNNTVTNNGGGVYSRSNFAMSGGTIFDNTALTVGGGVLNNGIFTLENGTISGNTALTEGGGVYSSGSTTTFDMKSNAKIFNNRATDGSGVYIDSGNFTATGGSIFNNAATRYGGGAYIGTSATFTMSEGTILNNTAVTGGGVHNSGRFSLSDGAISTNKISTGYGGGIYNNGIFTMSGGTISNNVAANSGGGGVCSMNGPFTMSNGEISGNSAGSGGGVYVSGFNAFTLSGGLISNNRASGNGGGIWVTNATSNLNLVFVSDGVVFSNNSASVAYTRAQEHDGIYAAQIGEHVSWTYPFEQGYNNFDISYVNGNPLKLTDIVVSFNVNPDDDPLIVCPTPASILVDLGSPYGALPAVEQFGYIFEGWSTEEGTPVTSTTKVAIGADHTLFAQWTRIMVPVNVSHVYSDSDIVGPDSLTLPIGEYDLSQLYELTHSNDGGTAKTYNVSKVVVEKYAIITYDQGSVDYALVGSEYTVKSPSEVGVPSSGFYRWSTVRNGVGGTNYDPGATFTVTNSLTLYAQRYVVTMNVLPEFGFNDGEIGFGGQGVGFSPTSITFPNGDDSVTVYDGDDLVNPKYTFEEGYFYKVTHYYELPEYFVTVIDSFNDVASGEGNYCEGDTVTISAGTRSGYDFSGWTVDVAGVEFEDHLDATTTFTMPTCNVTVTANWAAWTNITYVVHYYLVDTSTKVADSKNVTGQTMGASITENATDVLGYTAVAPTSITAVLNATGNVFVFYFSANTDIEYVVHYYLEGTSTKVADSLAVADQVMNSTVTVYPEVVTGYSAVESSLRGVLNVTGNVFVFYYTLDVYQIVYALGEDGVNNPNNPSSYTVEDPLPIYIASPSLTGSVFLGWSIEYSDGSLDLGPIFSFNISKGMVGDLLLTAQWFLAPGDVPVAVSGRVLPASLTGDRSIWFEVARHGDCSLIVRKDYLNINNDGSYGNPINQACSYSSSFTNKYVAGDCLVRSCINDWFNDLAPGSVDNLPVGARLRSYTVRNNAVDVVGSSNVELSIFDGLSRPSSVLVASGEDVAFALSFGEATNFLSKSFFDRNAGFRYSSSVAATNYAKIVIPWTGCGMWLRSPGDFDSAAACLDPAGRVYQYHTNPSGYSEGGLVYPALWVKSSIFDL
jgi:uncharacterized repeat protein (TIGR02543 family)